MANTRFRFYLLMGLQTCAAAAGTCFFPNGQEAKDDLPCDSGAANSMCCGGSLGTICLTNNLCRGSNGNLVRGSCTDKNWDSPECAMYCLGADTGGTDLISCSNVTSRGTTYCCNHAANCCDSGVGRFEVFPDKPSTWATFNPVLSSYVVVNTATTSASEATTSPSTQATTATSTSRSSVPTATSNSGAAVMNGSPDLSISDKIGIGIGAAIGVMLIAVVLFLQWRMYTKNRPAEEPAPSYPDACQENPQRYDAEVGKPMQHQQQQLTTMENKRVELPGEV